MTDAASNKRLFEHELWSYYNVHKRDLPWRVPKESRDFDPYLIMVSEFMLQQTQVPRVIPKFNSFVKQYPTVVSLSSAKLSDVLRGWQGLGYNRRAKYIWYAAKKIVDTYNGKIPKEIEYLKNLNGIGDNTAKAIRVYAWNQPEIFIETNIRTVFIHHFFMDKTAVSDNEIKTCVSEMIDRDNPREWYWAIMDYGTYLKKQIGNLNTQSRHYIKQTPFKDSNRYIRGRVIRSLLLETKTLKQLQEDISDPRLEYVIGTLMKEGLVTYKNDNYMLAE